MIFVFAEDGTLEVIAGADEARRNYEGVDVESGVFRFFDESGTNLEPRFTKPNKAGRLLGIFGWVESGEFTLVPAPDAEGDDIFTCLRETSVLMPNPWFNDLGEVRRFLTRG
jgi:hypothetical protein